MSTHAPAQGLGGSTTPAPGLRADQVLSLCVLSLLCFGVVILFSATLRVRAEPGLHLPDAFLKHAFMALLGVGAYLLASHVPGEWLRGERSTSLWKAPPTWALAGSMLLCAAVLVVGEEINGARRWIRVSGFQLQPSELAKWSLVLWYAWFASTHHARFERFFKGFLPALAPLALTALLVVIEDFGTAALMGAVVVLMLVVAGAKLGHLLLAVPPALAALAWFVLATPYRMRRMTSFLDPLRDPTGEGYHMTQSLLSFASGGVAGRGLGEGVQKLGYLPEHTTDFVFAVIAEETGILGCSLVIVLICTLLALASRVIFSTSSSGAARLMALGIACTIGLQTLINVGVATVTFPTKGMGLPLISAGGTSLVLMCGMLGLLARELRHSARPTPS